MTSSIDSWRVRLFFLFGHVFPFHSKVMRGGMLRTHFRVDRHGQRSLPRSARSTVIANVKVKGRGHWQWHSARVIDVTLLVWVPLVSGYNLNSNFPHFSVLLPYLGHMTSLVCRIFQRWRSQHHFVLQLFWSKFRQNSFRKVKHLLYNTVVEARDIRYQHFFIGNALKGSFCTHFVMPCAYFLC